MHLYTYAQNNSIKYIDNEGLALSCPDGQKLVTNKAGVFNCLGKSQEVMIFCIVCPISIYFGAYKISIAACTICATYTIDCIDKNSRCVCEK